MSDFGNRVRELGPLGAGEGIDQDELRSRLLEIRKLVPYIKVVKNEKLASRLADPAEYDKLFTRDEIDDLFSNVISYHIDPDRCQACMICARRCPVEAIVGAKNQIHVIEQEKCIKCGTCFDVCPTRFGAVTKFVGEPVPLPIPEEKRTIIRGGVQRSV